MLQKLLNLFEFKAIRFLFFGAITAAFNIILIYLIISIFQIETSFYRNLANFIAIEISLIFTFFVYRIWVWRVKTWNIKVILLQQIPKFHVACGLIVAIRTFIVFPILDWVGISYTTNTLIGIIAGAAANYLINNQLVFKD